LVQVRQRIELSMAKHRSLAGHPRISRRVAALLPRYTYSEDQMFNVDDAPDDVVARRRAALERIGGTYKTRFAISSGQTRDCGRGFVRPAVCRCLSHAIPVSANGGPGAEDRILFGNRARASP
jgi:hypothetical protein